MAKADTPLATYDAIVIGTGQAGPPLARRLAAGRMRVARSDDNVVVGVDCTEGPPEIRGSHLLLAVGRRPNTDDLGLDEAGIARDERGYIIVDDQLTPMCRGCGRSATATAKAPSRIPPTMISRSSPQTSSTAK